MKCWDRAKLQEHSDTIKLAGTHSAPGDVTNSTYILRAGSLTLRTASQNLLVHIVEDAGESTSRVLSDSVGAGPGDRIASSLNACSH